MMFNLIYSNHGNAPSHLEDWLAFVKCAIDDAGYGVRYSDKVCLRSVNILIENFSNSGALELCEAAANGAKYILIATEFMTNGTFNDFSDDPTLDTHYSNAPYWLNRCMNFMLVASVSRAVWCVSEQQLSNYRGALGPDNVHRLELRFVPGYATRYQSDHTRKDIDFLFTGGMTQYRQSQLSRLHARGRSVTFLESKTPGFLRNDYLARSHLSLNIPQHRNWPHPSQMRYFYAIMHGGLLLSETCKFPCHLDPYVLHAAPDDFTEAAMAILSEAASSRPRTEMFERFREEMPSRDVMRALIERSLGSVDG